MKAVAVGKKDYRDAVQSRALWGLVVVFAGLLLITSYAYVEFPELFGPIDEATFAGLVFFTASFASLFIPIAAIIVCYKALAGERELGSIKILLSLPVSRSDVLFGKLLGRTAVLGTGLLVGLVVGLGFGAALLGAIDGPVLVLFLLLTLAFTLVYASIVVGLSATTGSTTRATTLAIGFFFLFELLWDAIPLGVVYVVSGFSLPTEVPDWAFLISQLSPSTAYFTSVIALLPDAAVDAGVTVGAEIEPVEAEPFYVTPEAGYVFLALWLVLPLVVGYYQFVRTDM